MILINYFCSLNFKFRIEKVNYISFINCTGSSSMESVSEDGSQEIKLKKNVGLISGIALITGSMIGQYL